jgi:hypothetical protein
MLIEKGNSMLTWFFYGIKNSDVACLEKKVRPHLLIYIMLSTE